MFLKNKIEKRVQNITVLFSAAMFLILAGCGADQISPNAEFNSSRAVSPKAPRLPGNGSVSARISSGTFTQEYRSVGHISSTQEGDNFCTATLIGPRTVLTAAHCIVGESSGWFSNDFFSNRWSLAIPHPNFRKDTDYDIGLIILDEPITSVSPSPLFRQEVSAGQAIELVGYGFTMNDTRNWTRNEKYVGLNTVESVDPLWFSYLGLSNNCSGDSGGPSFINDELVGVHAWGDGKNACTDSIGWDVRVDIYFDWIGQNAVDDLGLAKRPQNPNQGETPTAPATVHMIRDSVPVGEPLVVQFKNLPGNTNDWIGIYSVDSGDMEFLDWQYTSGARNGTLSFDTPLDIGTYEARLFFNDSYTLQQRSEFQVTSEESIPVGQFLSIVSDTLLIGDQLVVQFDNLAVDTNDWVGIYAVGSSDVELLDWQYAGSAKNGTLSFDASLSAGVYEARLFTNNSDALKQRIEFQVTDDKSLQEGDQLTGTVPVLDLVVVKAEYSLGKAELKIEVVTNLAQEDTLTVMGYGQMTFNRKGLLTGYKFKANGVINPGSSVILKSSNGREIAVSITTQ